MSRAWSPWARSLLVHVHRHLSEPPEDVLGGQEAAGVAVNESTINTVFNHALGTLRAMDSLGLTITKQ